MAEVFILVDASGGEQTWKEGGGRESPNVGIAGPNEQAAALCS